MVYMSPKEIFLLLCIIFCTEGVQRVLCQVLDPCLEENHVLKIDETYRSSGNIFDPNDGHVSAHDRYLEEQWYRFSSPAGNDMPTDPQQMEACGATFPVWLNGVLPVNGQHVAAFACAVDFDSNCEATYDIEIKNCAGFNVYYLVPTIGSGQSYCIGSEVQCATGESSETGFSPGCVTEGFPVITGAVEIGFQIHTTEIDSDPRKVEMTCNLVGQAIDIQDIYLDVYWNFDDDPTFYSNIGDSAVHFNDLPATVPEEQWILHGGMGNRTLNQTLVVDEGSDVWYKFYSTMPILTRNNYEHEKLIVDVVIPKVESDICASSGVVVEYKSAGCGIALNYTEEVGPSRVYALRLHGVIDNQYDGNHNIVLQLRTPVIHSQHKYWENYQPEPVTILVRDADIHQTGHVCSSVNDPHMTTFDGRIYENQLSGEFILYRHTELPIEVQVYYRPCTGYATCNCGAAVRAGGDLFIYEYCEDNRAARSRLYSCEGEALDIADHVIYYEVTIKATGTRIEIKRDRVNIYPSPLDFGKTLGLCGTYDHDCGNDFKKRDGTLDQAAGTNRSCDRHRTASKYIHYNNFSSSWRVDPSESLYRGKIAFPYTPLPDTLYCDCKERSAENSEPICRKSTHEASCTQSANRTINECLENRRKRMAGMALDDVEEEVELFEYDPEFVPPPAEWRNGWTNESATEECNEYLLNNAGSQACLNVDGVEVETAISACVEDIMIAGDTRFSLTHLDGILASCKNEVLKNTSNFKSSDSDAGFVIITDILEDVCPAACNEKGICVAGKCVCDEGFTGIDCSFDTNAPPTLYDIQFAGLCDLQYRACAASPVNGETFILSEDLKCRLTLQTLSVSGVWEQGETAVTTAQYSHSQRVMCPFPIPNSRADTLTYAFDISVANDGMTYSNTKRVTVYNSECMACQNGAACVLDDASCFINGGCYTAGEEESGYRCNVCRPSQDQLSWTEENPSECDDVNSGEGSEENGVSSVNSSLIWVTTAIRIFLWISE